jgi:plasmid stabilization system protein ParE
MAGSVEIEWSQDALADLDRFAAFLHQHHASLAAQIARAIIDKAQLLSMFPRLGRPMTDRGEYRQVVLQVLNAPYVFQYRYDGVRLVMLRIFHGRELRE